MDIESLIETVATNGERIRSIVDNIQSLYALAKKRKLDADIVKKLLDVSMMVAEASAQNARLDTEIATLKKELDAQDIIQKRKRNYELYETPMGARVYRLKDTAETGEPPHQVCPNCFERDKIAILQPIGRVLECDACKAYYYQAEEAPVPRAAPGRWEGVF